jgi:osmotically-inducible protein OsmY
MRFLQILFCAALLSTLQGCFPVVAAGVGAGALMVADRRTSGTYVEDEAIELKAGKQIGDKYGDVSHINVTSYNRQILLTGEAPNNDVRADIGKIAASIENVKLVTNEIDISGISGLASRTSDTTITGKVKTRFLGSKAFQANHVKIVTESGVVYLMGLVYHAEGDAAAEIASTTSGVRRVVKVFEYLD